jgi:hypothetical protein
MPTIRPSACDSLRFPGGISSWTAGRTDCGDWQPMRWIIGIAAVLFCVCWLACCLEVVIANTSQPRAEDGWRRTTRGWERNVSLTAATSTKSAVFWRLHPHPLMATLLLVMLSVMLLVAFTESAFFEANLRERLVANQGTDSV